MVVAFGEMELVGAAAVVPVVGEVAAVETAAADPEPGGRVPDCLDQVGWP